MHNSSRQSFINIESFIDDNSDFTRTYYMTNNIHGYTPDSMKS